MDQYKLDENDACTSAASKENYGGNPPCDTRCVPGICKNPKEIKLEATRANGSTSNQEQSNTNDDQTIDCGCPVTCDEEELGATNGHHICGERIHYLMSRHHTSQLDACRIASDGESPPCNSACRPGVCQKPPKEEKEPVEMEFRVDCGCAETCDDLAQSYTNGNFICGQRLEYLMTKHHVTEDEACRQSTEGENPPCTTGCKPGVCKTPEPPLTILEKRELNVTTYDLNAPPKTSLLPWGNLTSMASYTSHLYSGFRNQMAVFTILILESIRQGHGQFMVESIRMKDTYGSNRFIKFEELWDVEHWNSYYPLLPRLVNSDPILHDQFDRSVRGPKRDKATKKWLFNNGTEIPNDVKAERPAYWGSQQLVMSGFMRYSKGRGPYIGPRKSANRADILMQREALRPHPNLQAIIDNVLASVSGNDGKKLEYMTVHARVEPDMQRHKVCRDYKVYNLTEIIRFMEEQWPEPPVSAVFMPINRELLEQEGYPNKEEPEKTNWVAVENLKALDDALENGLWGGKVKVFRFGANVMKGTKYEKRPSISGSMLAYFVALQGKMFVGTRVSSYSHGLVTNRFHRKDLENYEYLPDGIHQWTPPGTRLPPPFDC
ncbi:hypothetical protein IV203_033236 [Nitzschia inconspicua]|uniref:O-fucosyltransferase family protein n=1 Tax=Nitzschia inconspicua TaxID=303405 RepID=A0A9K3KMH6_9STRA|nr:hypothetical protein IV203_033236 [Nitzschia inconspicua]